jgi:hypothetical protein
MTCGSGFGAIIAETCHTLLNGYLGESKLTWHFRTTHAQDSSSIISNRRRDALSRKSVSDHLDAVRRFGNGELLRNVILEDIGEHSSASKQVHAPKLHRGQLQHKRAQCGRAGAVASDIDFSMRPRSLFVEMTAVVSFSNAARITSRVRRNENSSCASGAPKAAL